MHSHMSVVVTKKLCFVVTFHLRVTFYFVVNSTFMLTLHFEVTLQYMAIFH